MKVIDNISILKPYKTEQFIRCTICPNNNKIKYTKTDSVFIYAICPRCEAEYIARKGE